MKYAIIAVVLLFLLISCGNESPVVVVQGRVLAIGANFKGDVYVPMAFQHDTGLITAYEFCGGGLSGFGLIPGVRYQIVYTSYHSCDAVQQVNTLGK
jgi:hypothetical protein